MGLKSKERLLEVAEYYFKNDCSKILTAQHFDFQESNVTSYIAELKRRFPDDYNSLYSEHPDINEDEEGTIKFNRNVNTMTVIGKSKASNIDEFIKEANIDLSIWTIDKVTQTQQQVQRKNTIKDLCFDAGKISGSVVDGGDFTIETLNNFHIVLTKKKPDEVSFPMIAPVALPVKPININVKKRTGGLQTALIGSDGHFGFLRDNITGELTSMHDRRVFDLLLQVASNKKPDIIVLTGDMIDLAEWSDKFTIKPEFQQVTQPAIDELYWWLYQLRNTCPGSRIVYIEGNHEARMPRKIFNNMIEATNLRRAALKNTKDKMMCWDYILNLESLEIEYMSDYPNSGVWLNDKLFVHHGKIVRKGSGDTVKSMLRNSEYSEIIGHIHRQEMVSKTVHGRQGSNIHSIISFGCMCKLDGDIVPAVNKLNNWQNGIGEVVYEDGGNNNMTANPLLINDGQMIYENELYEGQSRLEDIRKDLVWNFGD